MPAKLLVTVLVTAAVGWAGPQAPEKPRADHEVVARAILAELSAGQFEKVTGRFDRRMAGAVPAARLAAAWQGMLAQFGDYRGITSARREEVQGMQLITLTCAFEKGALEARIAFNDQGQVAGLVFSPAGPRLEWKPPEYADLSGFREQPVTVSSGRWQLPGTVSLPTGPGPFPALVLVHGSGPHDQDETLGANKPFKDLAWGLASRGIAVLRYVKRTKQYGAQSSADPAALTVMDETVDDARAAVALLARLPEIAPKRIYVLGHSLGAMLGPRIAAGDPRVAGILILAGNTRPLEELLVEQVRYIANRDGKITEEEQKQIEAAEQTARDFRNPNLKPGMTVEMLGAKLPASYVLDLRNYHPAESAAALKIPVLVMQGGRDYQVRQADFDGWKKALEGHRNATLKLYPSLNHLFIAGAGPSSPEEYLKPGHVSGEVIQDIARWTSSQEPKQE